MVEDPAEVVQKRKDGRPDRQKLATFSRDSMTAMWTAYIEHGELLVGFEKILRKDAAFANGQLVSLTPAAPKPLTDCSEPIGTPLIHWPAVISVHAICLSLS